MLLFTAALRQARHRDENVTTTRTQEAHDVLRIVLDVQLPILHGGFSISHQLHRSRIREVRQITQMAQRRRRNYIYRPPQECWEGDFEDHG